MLKKIASALKSELKRNEKIISVGSSVYYPGIFNASDMNFYREDQTVKDGINIKMNWADHSFSGNPGRGNYIQKVHWDLDSSTVIQSIE